MVLHFSGPGPPKRAWAPPSSAEGGKSSEMQYHCRDETNKE